MTTRQSAWLARCHLLFFLVPYRRGGRSLGGRTRRLVAVTAHGIDVGDAHIAALIRAGCAVPLVVSRGSVPLARLLAWALAADTPTIIAKTLSPPIKARFIILPPFGQEHATIFIGSIAGNKIKEASACGTPIFRTCRGKIRINAGAVKICEGSRLRLAGHAPREANGLAPGVCAQTATARPARCPPCC